MSTSKHAAKQIRPGGQSTIAMPPTDAVPVTLKNNNDNPGQPATVLYMWVYDNADVDQGKLASVTIDANNVHTIPSPKMQQDSNGNSIQAATFLFYNQGPGVIACPNRPGGSC